MRFSLRQRLHSFSHALAGIRTLIRSQHNAWIHLAATLVTLLAALLLEVTRSDWMLLIFAIALVWMAEALNTAVELLADAVSREHNALIGQAKDVAAGGVLLAAVAAALIGLLVFAPHMLARLQAVSAGA